MSVFCTATEHALAPRSIHLGRPHAMECRPGNRLTWEELVRIYCLTLDQPEQNTRAHYNVCPTDENTTPSPPLLRATASAKRRCRRSSQVARTVEVAENPPE